MSAEFHLTDVRPARGVGHLGRLLALTGKVNLRAKVKVGLLVLLLALSVLVFLTVTALSQASRAELDEAIVSDLGARGTYRVLPSAQLGLRPPELLRAVQEVSQRISDNPVRAALFLPPTHPECPPYDQLGSISSVALLDATGDALPLEPGIGQALASDLCLAGLVVPSTALREASPLEKAQFGAQMIIAPEYARLVQLTSTQPSEVLAVISTGDSDDHANSIQGALEAKLREAAMHAGLPIEEAVVVARIDTGEAVRAASDGIALVYTIIGWCVLIMGGLGTLTAELIVIRDRMWYLGLTRALGARRSDIALMIIGDVLLVLVAGFGLAIICALALAPGVRSFGIRAFQADLSLLEGSALPQLLVGALLVLTVGSAYPAWRAAQLDPLDVLERRE